MKQAKEGFPHIFISPKRLERIRKRQKIGKWSQVPKDQLQLAEQLLKNKTAPFDPLLFKDRYQDSLLEVIKAKIEGIEPSVAVEEEREDAAGGDT